MPTPRLTSVRWPMAARARSRRWWRPRMEVDAPIGLLGGEQTAVIEMAAASGMALLSADQRDPTRTTTYGTGELMRAAADLGAKRIILGIGGSATIDGGVGAAQAGGAKFTLNSGQSS